VGATEFVEERVEVGVPALDEFLLALVFEGGVFGPLFGGELE
jgi:hypothetical protein